MGIYGEIARLFAAESKRLAADSRKEAERVENEQEVLVMKQFVADSPIHKVAKRNRAKTKSTARGDTMDHEIIRRLERTGEPDEREISEVCDVCGRDIFDGEDYYDADGRIVCADDECVREFMNEYIRRS